MGLESQRQKTYNCRRCIESGDQERRNCFLFGAEVQTFLVKYEIETNGNIHYKKDSKLETDIEGILDLVVTATDAFPNMSPLQVLQNVVPTVCPKSLISNEVNELLVMESFCREYHLPPLGNTPYFDYPAWLVDALGNIRTTSDRVRMQEYSKMKSKGGTT